MIDPKTQSAAAAQLPSDVHNDDLCELGSDQDLRFLSVWVYQGQCYVTSQTNQVLATLLGSCIAVCMRDPEIGIGGMNHFLLPARVSLSASAGESELRYGTVAIERLTNALISHGACRSRIEVKVFGGANVLSYNSNLGHSNADFVEEYLDREKLKVVAKSLRGNRPRRVRYYPGTGQALIHEGSGPQAQYLAIREYQIASRLQRKQTHSAIELFDSGQESKLSRRLTRRVRGTT